MRKFERTEMPIDSGVNRIRAAAVRTDYRWKGDSWLMLDRTEWDWERIVHRIEDKIVQWKTRKT